MESSPHPFIAQPNRTLIRLSIPVLVSLTAEPITALVDTAFISSMGVVPLAALGVGTTALSSLFWMFGFLGVGAQTEIAQLFGRGKKDQAGGILSLTLLLSALAGLLIILAISPTAEGLTRVLGASGAVQANAIRYTRIRLFGAPAVLLILTISGALRGIQDMRTPLWIALGVNGLNIVLDWLLIFGIGPFPALGVEGSALASTISQWFGALLGLVLVTQKIKPSRKFQLRETLKILRIGGDMFIRTGMLNLFLIYTTRAANQISPNSGAAHQVLRQMWVFTALALDAFAATVQSLVGFFIGRGSVPNAKFVVKIALAWSLGTGIALSALMAAGQGFVIRHLVPASAAAVFIPAWLVSTLSQPLNSIAFLTDGVHLGTGDYGFLRNAVLTSSLIGILGLWLLERNGTSTLYWIWILITVWIVLRGAIGLLRIWPGIGNSPFRLDDDSSLQPE
ncbi:MAG TPA: MATE family efflux transporter [Chloroflexi bacterium]|nr:MATE family efflux transporter [Chloroflexota bacterium]